MHFGFALELSDIDLLDTHLDLLDPDIASRYFVSVHSVFKRLQDMSSRRLQDFFSVTIFRLARRLQDVFKTFSRRLGRRKIVTLKTCWRRLQDQQMFAGLKSSFHFCSTLLLEWVSCRNNTRVDPIFSLKYCILISFYMIVFLWHYW